MPRSRTSSATELLVELRREDPLALHHQLERELRDAIRSGRLAADTAVPSTRLLADQLGLSRGVVVEAYEQLVAEGYLAARPGGATRVCARSAELSAAVPGELPPTEPRFDFHYGRPDVTQFPRQAWLRSLRRVLNEAPSDRMGYLDFRGASELREALASYLDRVRGTAAGADRMVITNGFAQGMALVIQVLAAIGSRRIAVEEPGQREAIRAARAARPGARPRAGRRRRDRGRGARAIERRRRGRDARPTTSRRGPCMSAERRAALVAWATRGRADRARGRLRRRVPLRPRADRGAAGARARARHLRRDRPARRSRPGCGSAGWWRRAASSSRWRSPRTRRIGDRPSLEQLAFADFLSRGDFDRHLRRMRPIYRARRDALLGALRRHLPSLRPGRARRRASTSSPGCRTASTRRRRIERAAAAGVAVDGVSPYYAGRS